MFESILGSLIATVIAKTLGEVYKRLAVLKQRLGAEMNVVERAKLEQEIESLEKELDESKQKLVQNVIILAEPFNKIYAVSHLRGLLAKSYGGLQENESQRKATDVKVSLGDLGASRSLKELSKALTVPTTIEEEKTTLLINQINNMQSDIITIFNAARENAEQTIIGNLLTKCDNLESNLFELANMLSNYV